jgi:hypothetical protein
MNGTGVFEGPTAITAAKTLKFDTQSCRKDITSGQYSACEERFNLSPRSQMNLSNKRLDIGKYATRSAKSSTGDMFTAPITGLYYDYQDNYDAIMKGSSTASSIHEF